MQNITNTIEGIKELTICLNLDNHLKFYAFTMMEVTVENGTVLKNEINKTIHSTITKTRQDTYLVQLEIFDIEIKNRTLSISEKEFISRIAEVNDDILIQINGTVEVQQLLNQTALQDRLEQKISRLAKSNVGPKVEDTFRYLRDFYNNEKRILLDTLNYKQHGLLLNPFYGTYTPTSTQKRKVRYLNFMGNTVANIEEEARVKKIKLKERELEVEVSGRFASPLYDTMFVRALTQKQIEWDAEKDKPSLDKYEGSFIFDMNTGTIKKASISIGFSFGANYKKTIEYQLNELNDADNN